MQKLYYSSGSVLLGDDVCAAVMEYSRALADVARSDLVTVPSLTEGDVVGSTTFLLGPASQLYATPVPDPGMGLGVELEVDLDDHDAVLVMRQKVADLQPLRGQADDLNPAVEPDFDTYLGDRD
ncbi:hypothetical protein [Herbiconiux liangxiaofengii]|uniref:hypothetical protein n=1 Tax=Herbiconiux liangxiaofengii TaxID=3342795 RepID=UPI0035BA3689